MKKLLSGLAALLFVGALVVTPKEADAKGIVVYQTGPDWFEAGPLPPPLDADPELQGFVAGYMCEVFGLFWAYMHWWDCKPVAFKKSDEAGVDFIYDNREETAKAVGEKYKPSDIKMGAWAKFGRFGMGAILIGLILVPILRRKKSA